MGNNQGRSKVVFENVNGGTINYYECCCTNQEQYHPGQQLSNACHSEVLSLGKNKKKKHFWKTLKKKKSKCKNSGSLICETDKKPTQEEELIQQEHSFDNEEVYEPVTISQHLNQASLKGMSNVNSVDKTLWDVARFQENCNDCNNNFKSQTNVQSVRSNAQNFKDDTRVVKKRQYENKSFLLETQTNIRTIQRNEDSDKYESSTDRKQSGHGTECSTHLWNERRTKPKISVSSFDDYRDIEDDLKSLDLRSESDTEELSCLKLPGPSINQECTETKKIDCHHMQDSYPELSSGYPLKSSNYALTPDLSRDLSVIFSTFSNTDKKDLSKCSKLQDCVTKKELTLEKPEFSSYECEKAKQNLNIQNKLVPETEAMANSISSQIGNMGRDVSKERHSVLDRTQNCFSNNSYETLLSDYANKLIEDDCERVVTCSHKNKMYDGDFDDIENGDKGNEGHIVVVENERGLNKKGEKKFIKDSEVNDANILSTENESEVNVGSMVDIKNESNVKNDNLSMENNSLISDGTNFLMESKNVANDDSLNAVNVANMLDENKGKNMNSVDSFFNRNSCDQVVFSQCESGFETNYIDANSDECKENSQNISELHIGDNESMQNVNCSLDDNLDSIEFKPGYDHKQFIFGSPQLEKNIIVNSFQRQNLLAIIIDRKVASKTSFICMSENGYLQEVTLDHYENQETCKSPNDTCSFNGRKDTDKKRKGNECFTLQEYFHDIRHVPNTSIDSKYGLCIKYGAQDFPLYHKYQRNKLPNEYHGTGNYHSHLPYGAKAKSESNLLSIRDEVVTFLTENIFFRGTHNESALQYDHLKTNKLKADGKEQPNVNMYGWENEETNVGQFSKSVSPTPIDSRIRRKSHKKMKKIKPRKETSMSSLQSEIQTYSNSLTHSSKKNNKLRHQRKGKKSWNQSIHKHQKSKKAHTELSRGFIDSGIFMSESIKKLNGNSVTRQYERCVENFFRDRERYIAKSVARHLIGRHSRDFNVGVLESYFDRVGNGPPTTRQERMRYEWLRLATFSSYQGNGNTLALARNGFYHDHNEGPNSTRCFLCHASNSNWGRFDDVNSEHRRLSPNCPFHENSEQGSVNVSITNERSESSTSALSTTSSSAPTVTVTSSTSSGTPAAVNEALRGLQIGQASAHGGESLSQQPTEDPESDHSVLALSQPRTLRALGLTGHSYTTIMAPTRNNIASGARSNAGVDPVSRSTANQIPGIRPSSIIGGRPTAGAFAGLNNTSAQSPVSRVKENLQQSNVPTPAVEAAAGAQQSNWAPGTGGRTDPNITVVVDNPKHPDYVNVESRVNTYHGWPEYLDQTPRQMSEAGFFFVGVADFTRCFCCGGGLRNWEPGDDPVLEHTRWFPRCEYINKLKGERYVEVVQRRHEEHMAQQQREQMELSQRRDENRNAPDPMTTEAGITLQEMGYSAELIRQAIITVRQQTGQSNPNTEQVLTWLLDNEERENGSGITTEFGVRPQPNVTSEVTTIVGTSIPSSIISTTTSIANTGFSVPTTVVGTNIENTGLSVPTTIVGTSIENTGLSVPTTIVGTSIPNTGFSVPSTIVGTSIPNTGFSVPSTIVGTSITSSFLNAENSPASSQFLTELSAPSTVVESATIIGTPNVNTTSSTFASTAQVSAGTTTSTVSSTSMSATARVQSSVSSATEEVRSTGSNGATGTNKEKQSGDNDESKQAAKDPSSNEPGNKSSKKKNGKKKPKIKPKSETAGATGEDIDAKSLREENEKLKEMQTCKICMENPVNTTLLPCGHLVCCETCAGKVHRCPICRKRIKGTVKTFMS